MKKGKHQSNSSEENKNVDLPGKDPITDVETPQKGKTESCDWPFDDAEESENSVDVAFSGHYKCTNDDAEESENSEDLAFSGHYKCTKINEEKQNKEKKRNLLSGKVPHYPSKAKKLKQMKIIWMKLMMFHQTVLLILRMMTFKKLKQKL